MAFGEDETGKLLSFLAEHLATDAIAAPASDEGEVAYSARVLAPSLQRSLTTLGIKGLVVGGSGAGPVGRVTYLGSEFIPDFTISYRGSRLIAFEVKFIRSVGTQNAIATAIGQAAIYRAAGFYCSLAFVVFLGSADEGESSTVAEGDHRNSGIRVVMRRAEGDGLRAGTQAQI